VTFRNALGLESGGDRIEARKIVGIGERDGRSFRPINHKPQAGLPDTAMAAAFLRALVRLVGTHPTGTITIPIGVADIGEIELVLCALGLIRDRRTSR